MGVDRGQPVRVVLADDECLFRASLRHLLTAPPSVIKDVYGVGVGAGFDVVGEAGSGEEAVRVVRAVRPDLLLLDLAMPRLSGLEALHELETSGDRVPTILLAGAIDGPQLLAAIHLGVRGLMLKDSPTEMLFAAAARVIAGEYWLAPTLVGEIIPAMRALIQASSLDRSRGPGLTPRERQVLALVAAGCANREIARQCSVSEETVKHHLTRMFDKVGASNRLELAARAAELGLHTLS